MKITKKFWPLAICIACLGVAPQLTSCSESDDAPTIPESPTYDMSGFARGADVGWLTEMEKDGYSFYNAKGVEMDCMSLLREVGMNAVRLRVWVNPANGWCNSADVIVKAKRAQALGYRIMIDFHYSDSWADPGQQIKPSAWQGLSLESLKSAITTHTTEVLMALKAQNIKPEWVQVGNEIRSGMLWDTDATLSGATWDATLNGVTYKTNQKNFAAFLQVASEAVRAVLPDAKVVVHCDKGEDFGSLEWIAGILKTYKVDYDVFGVSLYPDNDNWTSDVDACISNLSSIYGTYRKEVMVCEVGMPANPVSTAKAALTRLMTQCKKLNYCLGVFYWEPECYGGWQNYGKGAFDDSGKPTAALDAFAAD